MSHVILHGTPFNIESGSISDGGMHTTLSEEGRGCAWDYRKFLKRNAVNALIDKNYFDEIDGGVCKNGTWTDERRQLVHDKWLALIGILDRQLEEKGRFDIKLFDYFVGN